ncbi:MAG: alpha-methylacyl-CoA racemase [Parasphingorhabdus sp.]|jgi:alpha-methylacyl-CoA racemase
MNDAQPLKSIRVIDFTTLLPGPLATLFLARAGAEVIKVEPPTGDPMRSLLKDDGVTFELLNQGKKSISVDLKDEGNQRRIQQLCRSADVVIEQFRPGVMGRLNLDYEMLKVQNPDLVYAALTGYGQTGELASVAGHDINYIAESGLFDLLRNQHREPVPPPILLADIVGGAWPACLNILLALVKRSVSGSGSYVDISMIRGLQSLAFWAVPQAKDRVQPPQRHPELGGGLARYQIYRCADDRWLALGALEEKFWQRFCELAQVPGEFRRNERSQDEVKVAVSQIISSKSLCHWQDIFADEDVCCNQVRSLVDVLADLVASSVESGQDTFPLPLPIAPQMESDAVTLISTELGHYNAEFDLPDLS